MRIPGISAHLAVVASVFYPAKLRKGSWPQEAILCDWFEQYGGKLNQNPKLTPDGAHVWESYFWWHGEGCVEAIQFCVETNRRLRTIAKEAGFSARLAVRAWLWAHFPDNFRVRLGELKYVTRGANTAWPTEEQRNHWRRVADLERQLADQAAEIELLEDIGEVEDGKENEDEGEDDLQD